MIVHSARIVGPAAAGAVIALLGVGPCFLINALSFGAMIVALWGMDPEQLDTPDPAPRRRGDLRSGLAYVRRTPELLIPLAMMALVGTLSYNFQILLPLLADFTWHGTATTYALLTTAMGVGSVLGALAAGARGRVDSRLLVWAAAAFGLLMLAAAAAPTLPLQIAALIPLGMVTVTFAAGVNSTLQLAVDPLMRGRVMALYSVVFLGSTPIGAPLVGWLAESSARAPGSCSVRSPRSPPRPARAPPSPASESRSRRSTTMPCGGAPGRAWRRSRPPAAANLPHLMPEPRESRIRVGIRWRDLDLLGHVNQSVYHELLEEGRGALFGRLDDDAFPFVLVRVEIDYRNEVRRDHEWIEVVTRLGKVGTKSVTLEERIERSDGEVATEGRAVLVAWDPGAGLPGADRARARGARSGLETTTARTRRAAACPLRLRATAPAPGRARAPPRRRRPRRAGASCRSACGPRSRRAPPSRSPWTPPPERASCRAAGGPGRAPRRRPRRRPP